MRTSTQTGHSRAIYTVLIGGYETLKEVSTTADDHMDSICFTDDKSLTSATWRIEVVEPEFPSDPVRSQRMLKIRGHQLLDQYESTLYVDNSVQLKAGAGAILDEWLKDPTVDLALPLHSYRETVLDEFDELLSARYDDPARLYEQLLHYSEDHPDTLLSRPYWTAILARRTTPAVRASMNVWADHVLRYSRRDQLSARVALDVESVAVRTIEIDNFESPLHRWPVDLHRRVSQGKASGRIAGPIVADLRRLTRELAEARSSEERALAEASELRESNEVLLRNDQRHRDELRDMHKSTSWKLTAPIRYRPRKFRSER